jgi:hypothetical protein
MSGGGHPTAGTVASRRAGRHDTDPMAGRNTPGEEIPMTSNATPSDSLRDTVRAGVRDLSGVWWWFLALGVLWTLFGTYVLS